MVAPQLRVADSPAAAVLRAAVTQGALSRDAVARATGLSIATVNRQVAALIEAGLLRERADLAESGAVGRPRIPIEVNHDPYLTIGIHVGATTTGIVASDLRGRILGGIEIPTPTAGSVAAVRAIAQSAVAFADRWRRTPLWVGVALGGRVDATSGVVDHPRLGWESVPVGEVVADVVGLPVSVSAHVEAMAAAELLLAPAGHTGAGSTLYLYARETAGVAIALDGKVHTPNGGPGSITHLPTGSGVACDCGRRGCLEATIGDRGVVAQAVERGIVSPATASIAVVHAAARDGGPAHELLVERAEFLGHTVATLHDLLNPDRVILGGQAFTGYPPALPNVASAFAKVSTLARREIRVSGFGNRVQAHAAGVTSLSALYADPIAGMRRSRPVSG
ncbi:MAG TPA: ROK family transcriptional regulator [Aldersonia sp.]